MSGPRAPATQELRFARVASGARIAWARTGRGPALVRAAHWMTHVEHDLRSPLWQPWLERLGRDVTLVRYDARGCGSSGKDDRDMNLEAAVEELEVVVDDAGLERCALLGISGGAATAVAYAARHPERVTHLVLVGGFAQGMLRRSSEKAREYHEALRRLIEIGWGRRHPAIERFFTTTMVPRASPEEAAALNEQQQLSCDGIRAEAIWRAIGNIDVRTLLSEVATPTLVLHAEADALVPADLGRELAAAIPGARFEPLRTENHVPLSGEPAFERFCEAVREFLGAATPHDRDGFTQRERDLLDTMARGFDNLQIAAHLGIAEKTVRNALSKLYARLGVEGRPQAIVRARELGFGRS